MGGGRGGVTMSANCKKVGHEAGTLALIRNFDQISTCNSFTLLVMVVIAKISLVIVNFLFCDTLFF